MITGGKSLDFVICNKALEIVAAIEIDDQSHSTPAAQKRDITKNKAMETAGIKLIRWPATPLPSKEQIQIEFPSIKQPPVENVQDKKIKILERQLFDMAARLNNTAVTKA